MPAVAQKTIIGVAGSGGAQAQALAVAIDTVLLASGAKVIRASTNDGVGLEQSRIYRLPHFDGRKSDPTLLMVTSQSTPTFEDIRFAFYDDYDVQVAQTLTWEGQVEAQRDWSNPALWPSAGNPTAAAIQTPAAVFDQQFTVSGLDSYVFDILASEYGLFYLAEDGTVSNALAFFRPMAPQYMYRGIELVGTYAAPSAIGAPAGAHLIFECDGKSISVTFPVGPTLSVTDLARGITMAAGGYIEGDYRQLMPSGSVLTVKIPQSRAPSAAPAYAETRPVPRLALVYQDDTFAAAGFDFRKFNGPMTTVVGQQLRKTGTNWPLLGVRRGATVYNKTHGNSIVVERFLTTVSEWDTIVATTALPAGPWVAGDAYEVYPGPEGQLQGSGSYGAVTQIVAAADPTDNIVPGPDTDVICDDLDGEVFNHIEVGQVVPVHNNGCAVILTMINVVGTFEVGEEIVGDLAGRTGAVGIIRGYKSATEELVVDTLQGVDDGVVLFKAEPWAIGDTFTGQVSGATAEISTVVSASASLGWSALLEVVAKSRTASGGVGPYDFRTTLTLKTSDPAVNAGLILFPGAVLGIRAKTTGLYASVDLAGDFNGRYVIPSVYSASPVFDDVDVRRNEYNPSITTENMPQYDTSSLELSEFASRATAASVIGAEFFGAMAHFRLMTGSGALVSGSDRIDDDQDPNRTWKLSARTLTGGTAYGALTIGPIRTVQYIAIGPGAVWP